MAEYFDSDFTERQNRAIAFMDRLMDEDAELPGPCKEGECNEVHWVNVLSDKLERFAQEEVTESHLEYYGFLDGACSMRLITIDCMVKDVLRWMNFWRPDLGREVSGRYEALLTSAKEHDDRIMDLHDRQRIYEPATANPFEAKLHAAELARILRHLGTMFGAAMARQERRSVVDSAGASRSAPAENGAMKPWYVFKKEGDTWKIVYGEHQTTVKDSKGMQYIHHLVKNAGTPVECLGIERACSNAVLGNVKTLSSEEALDADLWADTFDVRQLEGCDVATIRQAKGKLEVEREGESDPSRKAELEEQIRAFDQYLGENLNIHGKGRPVGPQEDARKRVSNAIARAKKNIATRDAAIGSHFQASVKAKGTAFAYEPDREIAWAAL